jgi:hypothetical protein
MADEELPEYSGNSHHMCMIKRSLSALYALARLIGVFLYAFFYMATRNNGPGTDTDGIQSSDNNGVERCYGGENMTWEDLQCLFDGWAQSWGPTKHSSATCYSRQQVDECIREIRAEIDTKKASEQVKLVLRPSAGPFMAASC